MTSGLKETVHGAKPLVWMIFCVLVAVFFFLLLLFFRNIPSDSNVLPTHTQNAFYDNKKP